MDYIVEIPFRVGARIYQKNDLAPQLAPRVEESKLRTGQIRPAKPSEIERRQSPAPPTRPVRPSDGGRQNAPPAPAPTGPPNTGEPTPPEKKASTEKEEEAEVVSIEVGEEVFALTPENIDLAKALRDVNPDVFKELQAALAAIPFPGIDARGRTEVLQQKRLDILAALKGHI